MFLLDIIPIAKIPLPQPQILTYYTSLQLKKGSLVVIPLRKKKTLGLVINIAPLSSQKLTIKKADYQLKNILEIAGAEPILTQQQIDLALWISKYYWCPLGIIIKRMMPKLKKPARSAELRNERGSPPPRRGRQTLILVPQISCIEETIRALKEKNRNKIAVIHNKLGDKQRLEEWLKIKNNEAKFIVGTRSAVFAPYQNLSKIIIEEEENPHYKSSRQNPRFDARLSAIKLAELAKAELIFKSITPRIETFYNWQRGRNENINFHFDRANQIYLKYNIKQNNRFKLRIAASKKIFTKIVDMKKEIAAKNFSILSGELNEKIKNCLRAQRQIIIFVNRRGAATSIVCQDCGYVLKCKNCDAPLVYHLTTGDEKIFSVFVCHHCGAAEKPPKLCPNCQGHRIKFYGTGTEKAEIELKKFFPRHKICRLDSDVPTKEIKKRLDDFADKKIDILVGTEKMLNRNLPKVELVAALSIDTAIYLPDFRSAEKLFQKIRQLILLAKNKTIIQTFFPDNYAIQLAAKNDYQNFFKQEIEARKEFNYPPFSQLIKLTYGHHNSVQAEKEAEKLVQKLQLIAKNENGIEIIGPIPAFIPKKQQKYWWHVIIKLKKKDEELKDNLLNNVPFGWTVNVDPETLL